MTREDFDKILKALEKAFPPDPEQLKEGIAKLKTDLSKSGCKVIQIFKELNKE